MIESTFFGLPMASARGVNLASTGLKTACVLAVSMIPKVGTAHVEKRRAPPASKLDQRDLRHDIRSKNWTSRGG